MIRMLRTSAATVAATSILALPLMAQTAPVVTAPVAPPPAVTAPATLAAPPAVTAPATPAAPAVTAPAQGGLPAALTALGITDATVTAGRKGGQRVEGTLPGGGAFQAMVDPAGALRMIRTTDNAALPAPVAQALIPEAVRNAPIFAEFARVEGMAQGDEGVMVFGADTAGEPLRAGFAADGTLQRFGRGEMEGHKHGKGDHGRKDGDRKDRGKGHGKEMHGKEMRGDRTGPRGTRPSGMDGMGQQGAGQPAPLDDAAVNRVLTEGGYTAVGAITRNGPRVEAKATNPEGEAVTVTINPRGVVVRELAR
ncbi:hypothetical protein [Paracoccus sanguinis]|uniref:hypothetical protein n=1 Tax=Paracoccus sanguinis TaxID=1545044 RepID=UPI0014514BAB|nr:hypothetical protein [Paracoccus sanguinis]QJD15634.1 hypothetical protein HGN31_00990 [Paracoccus sanguinis]